MSLSITAEQCKFCSTKKAIYTCPKCNIKYCSSHCYRSKDHIRCSELFYRDWVYSSLESKNATQEDKKRMFGVLKRVAEQDSDDDEPEDEVPSLEERLAGIDLSKDVDENILWERLTKEERDHFETLLKEQRFGDILPIKKPWWTLTEVNLVEEVEEASNTDKDYLVSKRPAFPIGVKDISTLTSAPVADCVKYTVISCLYCYAYVMRFYNFDMADFTEQVAEDIFYLAPVLSEKRNYLTLEEVVQDSVRLLVGSKFNMPVKFTSVLANDACTIVGGPTNTHPNYFTLCALSDLRNLISNFYQCLSTLPVSKELKKTKKNMAFSAVKKIDFLISWAKENDEKLKDVASKLQLLCLGDIVEDIHLDRS